MLESECDLPDLEYDIEPEETTGTDRIVTPFDPTKIKISTQSSTIGLLVSRIGEGEIHLAPDFQRKAGIWNEKAKSRLIESLLIRIPLPAFYVDATDEDRWRWQSRKHSGRQRRVEFAMIGWRIGNAYSGSSPSD